MGVLPRYLHFYTVPPVNTSASLFALSESPQRFFFLRFAGLLPLLFVVSPANADWHGELNFRSDYVYRGYSKSQGHPVVQGLIDYQGDSGWFGGLGLSQVNFDNQPKRAEVEIKPYVGSCPASASGRSQCTYRADQLGGQVSLMPSCLWTAKPSVKTDAVPRR